MVQHLQPEQMVRSIEIVVYIYKTNGFPCIFSRQRKHDEPFGVQHIHRHHLNCDPQFREWEEQISEIPMQ